MSYQALLFCPEEKTARVVTQVLTELDFTVESCNEPFAAVKKLMGQHFDAVVVDCENEQNATLLFKSARNSGSNQSSLAVAVVEGQAGVAKAFRIGANLVLTKPINVEQSKGTLRVARGLLRKAEAGKPAGAASMPAELPAHSTPASLEPMRPATAAKPAERSPFAPFPQKAQPTAPVASTSDFELEKEPEPQPEPADEALLESMQDPAPAAHKPAEDEATPASRRKEYPWQPASKHSEPMASALRRAAEAAKPKQLDSPAASNLSSGQGAASAPAPAREMLPPGVNPWEPTPAAPGKDEGRPQLAIKKASVVDESAVEPPAFSALRLQDGESSEGRGSKKKLLIAAAVIVAAAIGYFSWSKMHSNSSQPAEQAPPPAAQTTAPATEPQAVVAEPEAIPAAKPSAEVKAPTPLARQEAATAPSAKAPSATKTTVAVAPADDTSQDVTITKIQEPIVVKNDAPKPAAQPAAPAAAEPPVPEVIGVAANTDGKALSGIVSAPVNVPAQPPQTIRISQGVSQGLLLKRVQPVYPQQALEMRLQGAVELEANISKDGSITKIKVLSGSAVLAQAAVDAVRRWKYQPYFLNGEPVDIQTQITVNFKLP
ncbi:MAG TPA: TonB family protein [Terriglobales bacterium]|jgi:protein TonB|nr:TonB family protein [Terriglobales bacterium]